MNPVRLLALAFLFAAALALPARADTVFLTNGGKVDGTLVDVVLKIGPVEQIFLHDTIKSLTCTGDECEVVTQDGTRYIGKIGAVSIRCVAGTLKLADKSVKSVEFGGEAKPEIKPPDKPDFEPKPATDEKPPAEGTPAAASDKIDDKAEPAQTLSPERKKEIVRLIQLSDSLCEESIKKAAALADQDYKAIKGKYRASYESACQTVAAARLEYNKYTVGPADLSTKPQVSSSGLGVNMGRTTTVTPVTGPGVAALQSLRDAEGRRDKIAAAVKSEQAAVGAKFSSRREGVRIVSYRVRRFLLTGKDVTEEQIKQAYEKALASVK